MALMTEILVKGIITEMETAATEQLAGKQIKNRREIYKPLAEIIYPILNQYGIGIYLEGPTIRVSIKESSFPIIYYKVIYKGNSNVGRIEQINFRPLADIDEQATLQDLVDEVYLNEIEKNLSNAEENREMLQQQLTLAEKAIKKYQFEKISIKASRVRIKDFTAALENIVNDELVGNEYSNELNLLLEVKRTLTDNLKIYGLEFSTDYVLLQIEDESYILFTYNFTHQTTEEDEIKLQGITIKPVIPMDETKTLQDLVVGVRSKGINKRIELLKKMPSYRNNPNDNEVLLKIEKLEAELKSLS
ncbi:hypothetical protein CN918_28900 [Priestia megaterium]|nr:hypothetical protein CN918_28900 [Priestia megaterium]